MKTAVSSKYPSFAVDFLYPMRRKSREIFVELAIGKTIGAFRPEYGPNREAERPSVRSAE